VVEVYTFSNGEYTLLGEFSGDDEIKSAVLEGLTIVNSTLFGSPEMWVIFSPPGFTWGYSHSTPSGLAALSISSTSGGDLTNTKVIVQKKSNQNNPERVFQKKSNQNNPERVFQAKVSRSETLA